MPTPISEVFLVKTCSSAENGDPAEMFTTCFAGFELPPGAIQAKAQPQPPLSYQQ